MERVAIQWSSTGKLQLAELSKSAQTGLLNKIDDLRQGDNPTKNFKPLIGPLKDYFRVCFSRYRAVYSVERHDVANGDVLYQVTVNFIAEGERTESDKLEIYRLAKKLVDLAAVGDDEGECDISVVE